MVLLAFFHHLLMDFVMPTYLLVLGQVISWLAGLPILVVTAYGALTIVYRSGIKWDVAAALLLVSMFGWATGVLPAIIDATISVNAVMHNTYWVPGHFHFYLLLGLVAMVFAFLYWLGDRDSRRTRLLDWVAFWAFLGGAFAMVMTFLRAGSASVPRRWAVHMPEWITYDRIASVFAAVVILAAAVFVIRFLARLRAIASTSG
jgi:cytochrome c oxidase subunit 1